LARLLAGDARFDGIVSLAGRTADPLAAPLPVRSGGFGGVEGLIAYLASEKIDLVLDATHPFAAQMSSNAVAACAATGVALVALERPPWQEVPGDRWRHFQSAGEAIAALPHEPQRIFSGLGRLSLDALRAAPQHHWTIRVIDPIAHPLGLPHATVITARGPFKTQDDTALFRAHGIDAVVAKNAGGLAAYSKIEAARLLGIPVLLIARPAIASRPTVPSVEAALLELVAHHERPAKRGV